MASKEYNRAYYLANRDRLLEYQRRYNEEHREQVRMTGVAAYAKQLQRGEQIKDPSHHHKGMAKLKEMLGDSRPEGLELSLINWDSPDAYWGWDTNKRRGCRLSTNPIDYAWETRAENMARLRKCQDESVTSQ